MLKKSVLFLASVSILSLYAACNNAVNADNREVATISNSDSEYINTFNSYISKNILECSQFDEYILNELTFHNEITVEQQQKFKKEITAIYGEKLANRIFWYDLFYCPLNYVIHSISVALSDAPSKLSESEKIELGKKMSNKDFPSIVSILEKYTYPNVPALEQKYQSVVRTNNNDNNKSNPVNLKIKDLDAGLEGIVTFNVHMFNNTIDIKNLSFEFKNITQCHYGCNNAIEISKEEEFSDNSSSSAIFLVDISKQTITTHADNSTGITPNYSSFYIKVEVIGSSVKCYYKAVDDNFHFFYGDDISFSK